MQSGGGSQQNAGTGGHGRSPASAAASPSSSSSAASQQQQQQQQHFDAIQQQQRQQALQQQLLRKQEGNETILAFQPPPGFQGPMGGGAHFMAAPNTLQFAQQRKYLEMVQQQGSQNIRDEGQNKNHIPEQQGLNPVQQAYMQMAMAAKQKSILGMQQPQGQPNFGIGSPSSGKDQDMRMANMKMQDLVSMQTPNQPLGVQSKKPSEPNITRPIQNPLGQPVIQNMGNNQMAVVAQVQAWAREQNIDLSQPMNANLISQLMPLMQSRMMAQQRTNEGSSNSQSPLVSMQRQQVTSPPIASESSPRANSSSEVSGSSGPTRARQAAPPGSFFPGSNSGVGNNVNNSPSPFGGPTRENQSPSMQAMMSGNGMGSVQVSRPSMNLNQGLEHSINVKNAANSQESMQMGNLRQGNQSSSRPPSASNDGGNHIRPPVQPPSQNTTQQKTGFTKQQLHVLKAQILAFRRLKKGESTLPQELLRAITPPPMESQVKQSGVPASTNLDKSSVRNIIDGSPKHVDSNEKVPDTQRPAPEKNALKEEVLPVEEKSTTTSKANMASMMPVIKEGSSVLPSEKEDQQSTLVSIKSEQDSERNMQKTLVRSELNLDRGKAIVSPPSGSESTQAKKPLQVGSVSQIKDSVSSRKYHGPLFDFPCFTRKPDSLASSVVPNNNLTLAYDIKDIISMEGKEVLKNRREKKLRKIGELLAVNLDRKRIRPDLVVRLQIEEKKLKLLDLQARVRDQVDQEQQDIMAMNDREYRKFVRICERQRMELLRQLQASQKAMREKQLKSIFQWRKKFLEAHWAIRDARTARNRGVAKYHERMLREYAKRKDDDRNKRMEALKNNDVERYREMLLEQQTSMPGDAAERYAVLSTFLTQTEEYLHKLGSKITAAKSQQEVQEAAAAAAAAARAQGLSEEEVRAAAACAGEEVMIRNQFSEMNAPKDNSSVNKYYSLAHAINERVVKQPSMLRAGTLRDYQLVGLQWMLSLYNNKLNGILADEMGLGKTVQVMSLIAYLMEFKGNYGPHLIIVPNAVLVNWKSELHTWLPSVSCIYYVGTKDQRAKLFSQEVCAMKFNVLVTTYEFIMFDRSKLSKVDWKYIIIDEAQRMKDRESVLARDLDRYRCQRRLLLTGTPLQNDLKELWSLLNLLLPEVFDNRKAFHDWFSQPFQKEGPTHNAEDDWLETEKKVIIIHRLHQILEPFMLRRRVEDVEGSLPPKVPFVLKCKMSAIQSAIYDWVKTTGTLRLDPEDEKLRVHKNEYYKSRTYRTLNNRCMELRKVCNHPLLTYPYFNDFSKDFLVKSCGKLWILDRILIKLQRTGHRVLLFSTMTKLLDILEEYLQWRRLSYRRIDGTTTLEDRESAIVDFNDPQSECFIFLLSIRAAGRGLNLQTADTVIIYDPDPNPKNEEQAVARAHRIGQKREVKVIYMETVVDKISSHLKEDEFRSGGVVDLEDDLAGKDRYMGSIESLIRNNIQQYKIDMADEVINAGRFDQRTTHEERRMTLETLLHDEERYQETVHDVPSLQEVNRMIARSKEEVVLFDQMDEEFDWIEEMTRYDQVPEWLRASTVEVNAAISSLSKKPLKEMISNNVIDETDTIRKGRNKGKRVVYTEMDDDIGESSDAISEDRNDYSAPEEEGEGGEDEDEEEEEEDGETQPKKDLSEDIAPGNDGYDYSRASGKTLVIEHGSPGSSSDSRRMIRAVSPSLSSQKFATLSAIDARPSSSSKRLGNDLEEGEIAVSGDSPLDIQQSGSWNHEREEREDEQVVQPKIKRKRSIRLRPRHSIEKSEEKYREKLIQHGEPSPSQSLADHKFGRQVRNDSESKKVGDLTSLKHDQTDMSSKTRKVLPSKRTGSTSKLHASTKPGQLNSLSNPSNEAGDNSRDWDGNKDANTFGNSSVGAKMSEFVQKKCKFVIGKVQRRMEKEGHVVPLLSDFWKRIESSGYNNGPGNKLLDLRKIFNRIERLQYGGVVEVVNDVQLMLKSAVQHYGFSHEVTCEARKFHDMFMDTLKASFPDIDFEDARNSVSFYGPPSRGAASSQGNRKHRMMNEVERDMSPSPRQPTRGLNMTMKESRLGSNSSNRDRDQNMGPHDDSPVLTHPGDLVVCKKKRKDREKPVMNSRSGSSGPVSPPSMGRSIRSPGSVSTPRENRAVGPQQVLSNQSAQPVNGSGSSSGPIGWANPVKRLRTDAGKRRPSIM